MERRTAIMLVAGLALLAAVIVGVVRSATPAAEPPLDGAGTPMPTTTLTPSEPSTAVPSSLVERDGHNEDDAEPTYTPTNVPSPGGGDNNGSEAVPETERDAVLKQNTAFWAAFSIRDPKARDKALAKVAVPYLAARMSVPRTDRIPVVKPAQVAIVAGSFSSAYVVTQAATGEWWYVNFVYDPADESWGAQVYEPATSRMIADAKRVLVEG